MLHAGVIAPVYTASDKNIADGFTKPLNKEKFEKFRFEIGVHSTTKAMKQKEE